MTILLHEKRFIVKRRRQGFTIVELLTVLAVIAILIGLLLPATTMVRRMAHNTRQKSQMTAIALGLEAFRNDFGFYPPSNASPNPTQPAYCGAQKLAIAMVGLDTMGFNRLSTGSLEDMSGPGGDQSASHWDYYTGEDTLALRQDPYVPAETANAFQLGNSGTTFGLFSSPPASWDALSLVLCDTFGKTLIQLRNGQTKRAGAPLLYFRANPLAKTIRGNAQNLEDLTYNFNDNAAFVQMRAAQRKDAVRPLAEVVNQVSPADFFYGLDDPANNVTGALGYIQDPTGTIRAKAYNPDSYLLISAGEDGIYGTPDDICNFGN